MASEPESEVSNQEESSKIDDYNPKLDFFSEQFDPLLALRTPDLVVPVSNATIYDNIHKYKSVVEGKPQEKPTKPPPKEVPKPLERRWLPHQLPIMSEKRAMKKNLFTRMENMVGPLQLLKSCIDKRHKIKVWTRHSHDIRGYCIAYLVAFDKYWNLALEEVEEVWTRARRRKIPALESAKVDFRVKSKIRPPPITIIKSTQKTETCSRHVNQLLLRGEHVAYIVVLKNEMLNS